MMGTINTVIDERGSRDPEFDMHNLIDDGFDLLATGFAAVFERSTPRRLRNSLGS
jgi:hypothetical protein